MSYSIWFKLEYNLAKNSNGNLGGKIRLIEGNAKCRHRKSDLEMDFASAIYLSKARSLLGFYVGVVEQFCRF